jgi:hypothetical protein
MLVHVPTVDAVQMVFVEIIDVVVVLDGRMAASAAVAMRMLIVRLVIAHGVTLTTRTISSAPCCRCPNRPAHRGGA